MTANFFNPYTAMADLWQAGLKMNETLLHTHSVLNPRTPILWSAFLSPMTADYRELQLMVTEKVDAFGRSARYGSRGAQAFKSAIDANTRDFGRLSAGTMLWRTDWLTIMERTMAAATALFALPGRVVAPVHTRVAANARRLGS